MVSSPQPRNLEVIVNTSESMVPIAFKIRLIDWEEPTDVKASHWLLSQPLRNSLVPQPAAALNCLPEKSHQRIIVTIALSSSSASGCCIQARNIQHKMLESRVGYKVLLGGEVKM